MKKIMFSTEYGLEQDVLAGTKTQTRRIMMPPKKFKGKEDLMLEYHRRLSEKVFYDCVVCDADGYELGQMPLPYKMGFDYVGCELDKEYFDKGCERFNRECKGEIVTRDGHIVKQTSLFDL